MIAVWFSAVAQSANILLDKYILSHQKVKLANYMPILFVFLFLITLLTIPWLGSVNNVLVLNQTYMFYFILMVMLAIVWNIFYYQGLQKEKILDFEVIILLTPLVTILMASLFFPEEYNRGTFIAAIIASLALLLSHVRKHHLDFNRYTINLLLAIILTSMEAMVQKELLSVYSPALLYLLRTAVLALFFLAYYRPKVQEVSDRNFKLIFATALMGVVYMVAKFYGYQQIGITLTTLLLLVVPVVTSWYDANINGTPVRRRTVVGFIVILLCVIYAILHQSGV